MRLLWSILLCCFASAALAADTPETKLAQLLRKPEVLRGNFSQSRQIAGFKKPVVSSGSFVVARGRGLLWITQQPFESTLSVTRDRLRETNGAGQPETILDARREPMLGVLNELLQSVVVADIAALNAHFTMEARVVGTADWELVLRPRDAALRVRFSVIELSGSAYVKKVRMSEKSGDSTTVLFEGQVEDAPLTEAEAGKLK